MFRQKGFTLLEVLISALLIMVGLGALGVTVVAGKRFLKQAEYRSQAMSLASTKMQELLAKGYNITNGTIGPEQEGSYNWTANVTKSNKTGTEIPYTEIPYKDIEVVVSYDEENGSGGLDTKNIRLTNIIPYPKVHAKSTNTTCVASSCEEVPPDDSVDQTIDPDVPGQYQVVQGDTNLMVRFNYAVKKDIKAAYTISIRADEADNTTVSGNLDSLDTIYSTFFLDNDKVSKAEIVRTPIMSQPTFSGVVVVKNVSSNVHDLEVRWVKRTTEGSNNSAGKIWLIDGSLSIIATEVE